MSGMQATYVGANPIPPRETIVVVTAPPPEPRKPIATSYNNGYFSRLNRQNFVSYAGEKIIITYGQVT